ncbi:hypothetical protein PVT68_12680 [Microbulbifer bruguierae]|uniref:Uncharacterized protein n=1 Tax=Microbulbifer bruguierae TaxID=3029061 RepID=A0ABY8N9Q9_9GAMM|nr:hypothetical protein [Microbulbifer bruguierae]WGL15623.1 hypothetical protein PVT68_12680 [Microbulbifer bruguierae]
MLALILCASVRADAETTLHYAGFSYLGRAELIEKNFPYTHSVDASLPGGSRFDAALAEKMKRVQLADYGIAVGKLASLQDQDALGLTLALESEMVSVEQLAGQYKLLIQLSAQILIFDYAAMKIVATYPIDVQFNDLLENAPTYDDIRQRFERLYFGDAEINLLNLFVDRLGQITPNRKHQGFIKVVNVALSEQALTWSAEQLSPQQLRQLLGQSFTRNLAVEQQVSVLPYSKGHAVGNKLALQYASGDAYMIEIPEPDYAVDIELRGLKKKHYSSGASGEAIIYAAQGQFTFYEPFSGTVFYQGRLHHAVVKKVPAGQQSIADWPSFRESILTLFQQVTRQLEEPDRKWFEKHSGGTGNYKSFQSLTEVITRCR